MFIELLTNLDDITSEDLQSRIQKLPLWRQEITMRLVREIDRKLSCVGYELLQKILQDHYKIYDNSEWSYGENEKPYLSNYPDIHFNLSHCPYGVICVVDSQEIGVDIESVENIDLDLVQVICSDIEQKVVVSSPDPKLELTKIWTQKESLLKLRGTGLVDNLKGLLNVADNIEFTTHIDSNNRYVITICQHK